MVASEYGHLGIATLIRKPISYGAVILVAVTLCTCMSAYSQSDEQTEFAKLIAARPFPDLERLAERSAPNYTGKDVSEAFYDILKLREVGDTNAVPVLEKIMADNLYSTRIHGFAASQALFCIGTQEAHQILSKYLLTDRYFAGLGINYTFHWQMQEPRRRSFIEQYHLKSISKDLAVKLDAEEVNDANDQYINFIVVLHNLSDEPLRILDRQVYRGRMLYFFSDTGQFVRRYEPVEYKMLPPQFIELVPNSTHRYDIRVYIKRLGEQKLPYWGSAEDATIVLETNDMIYDIAQPGRFKVYAMVEAQPPTKAQIEKLGFENLWSGRVVSQAVDIKVRER